MLVIFWIDLLMYQGGLDVFFVLCVDILLGDEVWGCDMEGEVVVICGDVLMGCFLEEVVKLICLIMLVNDVLLCGLILAELVKGFGFFQFKLLMVFLLVVVILDELGEVWDGKKVFLLLVVYYNNEFFGVVDCGVDMMFDFLQLVVYLVKMCLVMAGMIIGLGIIFNKLDDGLGKLIFEGGVGYFCIVEICMIEMINDGKLLILFMKYGDIVKIQMKDKDGKFIFGVIEQIVVKYEGQVLYL